MKILIETPKYSFIKYRYENSKFLKDLFSPFPNLFNYGFIIETKGYDDSPKDVIVLGKGLNQGIILDLKIIGEVKFIDKGLSDIKYIASQNNKITTFDKLKIKIFFVTYSVYKVIYYLIAERKIYMCKYLGIRIY